MRTIDFHTHAFPDTIAPRAMQALSETDGVAAFHDGTVAGLVASMDAAGIGRAVICSIATKPEQFLPILEWSKTLLTHPRVVPFPSLHPADPDPPARVREIAAAGFRGIKIHPYYQDFDLLDERMLPAYAEATRLGLILVSHTGFDFAFPDRIRLCDPQRILTLTGHFPDLRFVATHLGGWDDWDEVERLLVGRPIWMEISFGPQSLPAERLRRILENHPADRLLFGSDSPWTDQGEALRLLEALALPPALQQAILYHNAERLLGA